MRGRLGFFGLLFIVVLALLVGGVAYTWGLAAGQAAAVAPGTIVYPVVYAHSFGFGFGIFGFLFFLLLIGLVIRAFRPHRFAGHPGGWSPGGWGPGGWGGHVDPKDPRAGDWTARDIPPAFQPMLETWHRRAHGESGEPAASPPSGRDSA